MAEGLGQFIVPVPPGAAAPGAWRIPALIATLVVFVVCLAWWVRARGGGEGAALAAAGWTLYTREGCGFCDKQMAALGGSYPRRVRCDGGAGEAAACGPLEGFPAWRNARTGAARTGLQTGKDFRDML